MIDERIKELGDWRGTMLFRICTGADDPSGLLLNDLLNQLRAHQPGGR
jgi:hypothetical protein